MWLGQYSFIIPVLKAAVLAVSITLLYVLCTLDTWCIVIYFMQLCRVVKVHQRILSLLNGANSLNGETVWSRRQLITWCRAHLCSPLDNGLCYTFTQPQILCNALQLLQYGC